MNKKFWWQAKGAEAASALVAHVTGLRNTQQHHQKDNLRHVRLYGNLHVMGLGSDQYTRAASPDRLSLNAVKRMTDTAQAKITSRQPRPSFITSGADYSAKRKAKKLQKLVDTVFYDADMNKKATKAFKDACIVGTGALKICEIDGKVGIERTFVDELTVDDRECLDGCPRNLFQLKSYSKAFLCALYPSKAKLIEAAGMLETTGPKARYADDADRCDVVEAWHLPSSSSSKDGRHLIVCGDAVLLDEPWIRDHFPFAFVRWSERPLGFWGCGLAEELAGIQFEINKLLRTIQASLHLHSVAHWMVERSSKVNFEALSNDLQAIIEYSGKPPELKVFQSVPPELFAQLDRLYAKAYEITGISQMAAEGRKEPGLKSGVALREMYDIQSENFAPVAKEYEQLFMSTAKLCIETAREIYERDGQFKVKAQSRRFLTSIDWSEIDLDDDEFVMQVFPTSMLPTHPAGRLQAVSELEAQGKIDHELALQLLDMPDLESAMDLETAAADLIDELIERMLERGEYLPPDSFMDLNLAMAKVTMAYNRARLDGVEEERLELLRTFLGQTEDLLKKAAESQQPPEAPPGPTGEPAPVAPQMAA
jgi:hypothetical protein